MKVWGVANTQKFTVVFFLSKMTICTSLWSHNTPKCTVAVKGHPKKTILFFKISFFKINFFFFAVNIENRCCRCQLLLSTAMFLIKLTVDSTNFRCWQQREKKVFEKLDKRCRNVKKKSFLQLFFGVTLLGQRWHLTARIFVVDSKKQKKSVSEKLH